MWPGLTSRFAVVAGSAAIASVAGFALAWNWRGADVRAAEAHGQAVAAALVAANERARADQAAATLAEIKAAEKAAEDRNRDLKTELEGLRAAAARRPATVTVRVPVPADCPEPAAAGGGAGPAAGGGPGAAADGGGVGGDGPGRDRAPELVLDVSGIWAIVDTAKAVSARLRAAQEVCGG